SACGRVGLMPSRGRVSLGPVLVEWIDGFTCVHVLTRTVRDCAALLDLTAGPAPGEPYGFEAPAGSYLAEISKAPGKLRIAYYTGSPSGRPLHEDCKEAVLAAARLCEELGHEVEEAAPAADLGAMLESWKVTYFASAQLMVDMAVELLTGEKPRPEDFEPLTLAMAERARGISAFDYQVAAVNRQMQARVIGEFHESYDLWLTPSMALPPVPTGTYCGNTTDLDAVWDEYHPYSPIQNATGQPSVSLPLYWNADGLPIGTMFTAALGNEALLFRIGAQLEQARPWIGRTPPVVAG
ncbi:MAG: amidase, partial [Candidatus Binatia bacterium]